MGAIKIQTNTTNRVCKKDIIKLVEGHLKVQIEDPVLSREGLKWTKVKTKPVEKK